MRKYLGWVVLLLAYLLTLTSCFTRKNRDGCGPYKGSRDWAKVMDVKKLIDGRYKFVLFNDRGSLDTMYGWKYIAKDSCALVCRN